MTGSSAVDKRPGKQFGKHSDGPFPVPLGKWEGPHENLLFTGHIAFHFASQNAFQEGPWEAIRSNAFHSHRGQATVRNRRSARTAARCSFACRVCAPSVDRRGSKLTTRPSRVVARAER